MLSTREPNARKTPDGFAERNPEGGLLDRSRQIWRGKRGMFRTEAGVGVEVLGWRRLGGSSFVSGSDETLRQHHNARS